MEVRPQQLQSIYRRRFTPDEQAAKARIWQVLVTQFFQRWIRPGDTVLDLGCGNGEFLNHVRCARRLGVDLNPDSAGFLDPGIEFHLGSVCELGHLADGTVDVIFTSNLMEHLPGKPSVEAMLREGRRVLKPGGRFVALGPNLRFLAGEYWDFWDHVVPITDRSLVEVLETVGFKIEVCRPRFLPYTTKSVLPQWPWMVGVYLRTPLAWRVLGRQFLVVAQRAEGHPVDGRDA